MILRPSLRLARTSALTAALLALAACESQTPVPPRDAASDLTATDTHDATAALDLPAPVDVPSADTDVAPDVAPDASPITDRNDAAPDVAPDVAACTVACVGGRTCMEGRCEDAWRSVTMSGAPTPRSFTAWTWTGTELLIWGGQDGATSFGDGAAYNPTSNRWRSINPTGAPSRRSYALTVWTGREVVVWGGSAVLSRVGTGARLQP